MNLTSVLLEAKAVNKPKGFVLEFVGSERELREAKHWLEINDSRELTLTGNIYPVGELNGDGYSCAFYFQDKRDAILFTLKRNDQ